MTQNLEQQPTGTQNPAPPSDDWKAKYEEAVKQTQVAQQLAAEKERQYNSVQGNLTKAVEDRRKAEADLKNLSESSEMTKAEIAAEKARLEAQLKEKTDKEAQLAKDLEERDNKLTVLSLITTKYPSLAGLYGKGRLRTEGLSGAELEAFLAGWDEDVRNQQIGQLRQEGESPKPPNGQQTPMTYEEILKAKAKALREKGPRSPEFTQYLQMEEQAIREGRHKPR